MNNLKESPSQWEPPAAEPLDEAVWQAWVAKGRAQDRQSSAGRVKAVQFASIVGLLAAAVLWSDLAGLEIVIRLLVTAGAMVVMVRALQSRYYTVAAAFFGLALLYNPVAPMFTLSGDWQRAVVLATVAPFVASLAWPDWRNVRVAHND
jgi:hypothetical protein